MPAPPGLGDLPGLDGLAGTGPDGLPVRPGPGRMTSPAGRHPVWVTPETARRMACDGLVRRLILDPQGIPLDLGRATRTVTPAQDTAVRARDLHCRWTGCTQPIQEIHHVHHWAAGGPSDLPNYGGFCDGHHHLAHHPHWRIEGDANATITFTHLPTGRNYHSRPPTLGPSALR